MTLRQACLSLPAAGLRHGTLGMAPWRSLRMCTSMAQEQETVHTFTVPDNSQKRLDAFLSATMQSTSRARLQNIIKEGYVAVNGKPAGKAGQGIRRGDIITCEVPPTVSVEASPEDLPLEVVYEDQHLIVLNKAAGLVVHPGPGNYSGTLVNALLHRFGMPAVRLEAGKEPEDPDLDDSDDGDEDLGSQSTWLPNQDWVASAQNGVIRPGIVHRLDKGTTGLLVVAKDAETLAGLGEQFKAHTVERVYQAIAIGCPKIGEGVVETNIGRDIRDRKKMGTFPYMSSRHSIAHAVWMDISFHKGVLSPVQCRGRHAVSTWKVLESLAGGTASLMQWKLKTGRTHQIRVHAKHMQHPLLSDETYGGAGGTAVNALGQGKSIRQVVIHSVLKTLNRPALHAKTLGFVHPVTQEQLHFSSDLPEDFQSSLESLRGL